MFVTDFNLTHLGSTVVHDFFNPESVGNVFRTPGIHVITLYPITLRWYMVITLFRINPAVFGDGVLRGY